MSSPLKQNTATIQELLNTINSLPEAGTDLPELTNEGSASDLLSGKQLIDSDGNVVDGTFTIDTELDTQDNLISQIQTALQNKAAATGEDVTAETTAYTNKLATLETAITALETELQGKAGGGSGGGIETCTVTFNGAVRNSSCIITQYINEEFNIIWSIPESNYTYENVVCGSGIYLAGTYVLGSCTDGILLYSGIGCCYQAPTTAGATAILTLVAD